MKWLLPLLCAFAVVSAADAQESVRPRSCDLDGDMAQAFDGVLLELTFPGPPNYLSVAAGDEPETVFVLQLPHSICRLYEVHVMHVQFLQLVFAPDFAGDPSVLVGEEVRVSGVPEPPLTGHHHTDYLLRVEAIARLTPG